MEKDFPISELLVDFVSARAPNKQFVLERELQMLLMGTHSLSKQEMCGINFCLPIVVQKLWANMCSLYLGALRDIEDIRNCCVM